MDKYRCREVFCADSWLALTQSTYLIVFLPKCECQFTRWSGSTNPHHSSSDTPRTEIFGLYTTAADENTYIEPRAQRWKTHIMQSAHRLPIYTCAWLSSGILGWKKAHSYEPCSLSHTHTHALHKPCNPDSLYISTYFPESLPALACSRQWQATNPWHRRWW